MEKWLPWRYLYRTTISAMVEPPDGGYGPGGRQGSKMVRGCNFGCNGRQEDTEVSNARQQEGKSQEPILAAVGYCEEWGSIVL